MKQCHFKSSRATRGWQWLTKVFVYHYLIEYASINLICNGKSDNQMPLIGKSSYTLLKNIQLFDRIYVSYQNCAWSPQILSIDDDEDGNNDNVCQSNTNNNNNNNNDRKNSRTLNGDENEDKYNQEYWYMTLSSNDDCYQSNVAYTLYGTLKTSNTTNDSQQSCDKNTFINTYYTNVKTFIQLMESVGIVSTDSILYNNNPISSTCISDEYSNDDQANNDENIGHNQNIYKNLKSYGIGCNNAKHFVYNTYQGKYCNKNNVIETVDKLQGLNDVLHKDVQCILIYDTTIQEKATNAVSNYNNNQHDQQLDDVIYSETLQMLQYSSICNIQELGSNQCPDPYGYLKQLNRAQSVSMMSYGTKANNLKHFLSWLLLVAGILFILASMDKMLITNNTSESSTTGWLLQRRRVLCFNRTNQEEHHDKLDNIEKKTSQQQKVDRGWWFRKKYKNKNMIDVRPLKVIEIAIPIDTSTTKTIDRNRTDETKKNNNTNNNISKDNNHHIEYKNTNNNNVKRLISTSPEYFEDVNISRSDTTVSKKRQLSFLKKFFVNRHKSVRTQQQKQNINIASNSHEHHNDNAKVIFMREQENQLQQEHQHQQQKKKNIASRNHEQHNDNAKLIYLQ